MEPVVIYITAANREEAISLARELLGKKLAACINISEHMTSLYWWSGEIEQSNEAVLVVKTFDVCADGVVQLVKQLHSYDCPAIVVLPVKGGNPDYIEWMRGQVAVPTF